MKILIVGAGPAGLALATFLDTSQHEVVVIEKEKEFSTMGYGLYFLNEARKVLERIVPSEEIDECEIDIPSVHFYTRDGSKLFTHWYSALYHLAHKDLIVGMKREDLQKLLLKYLPSTVQMNMGVSIRYIENVHKQVKIETSDGLHRTFDMVVDCSGVHSQIREQFFSSYTENLPYRNRYMWLPRTIDEYQIEFSPHNVIMNLPVPRSEVCLLLEDMEQSKEESKEYTRQFFMSVGLDSDEVDTCFEQSQVYPMRYLYTSGWHSKRVVLIGDAQHAMTSTFGYGTLLALEDAYVLSTYLNTDKDPEKWLSRFARKRTIRVCALRFVNKTVEFFVLRKEHWYQNFMARVKIVSKPLIVSVIWLSRFMLKHA